MPSKKQTKATNKKINKLTPTEKLKNQINNQKMLEVGTETLQGRGS